MPDHTLTYTGAVRAFQSLVTFALLGQKLRLADYQGKVVLLNFWATWCPPCREEMPAMERLYQRYKDRGVVVLAVSVDAEGGPVVSKTGGVVAMVFGPREWDSKGANALIESLLK